MDATGRETAAGFALLLRNPASGRAGEDLSAVRERFIAGGLPLIDAPAQDEEALRAARAAALSCRWGPRMISPVRWACPMIRWLRRSSSSQAACAPSIWAR